MICHSSTQPSLTYEDGITNAVHAAAPIAASVGIDSVTIRSAANLHTAASQIAQGCTVLRGCNWAVDFLLSIYKTNVLLSETTVTPSKTLLMHTIWSDQR